MPDNPAIIQTRNLSVRLGEFHLKHINLEIQMGEYFVILGPTGSGKTVLLETLAGLNPVEDGSILLDGKEITHLPPEKRGIGFVYQDYALFPHLSVAQNIAFGPKLRREKSEKIEQDVKRLSKLLAIEKLLKRKPETLSGGEQQRAALARALITQPKVLLLDEPLSALDPGTKEELQNELLKVHRELGTTILHVTHNFEEALTLGQRVAVFNEGQIVQCGTPDDIFRKPESNFVAEFVGTRNIFSGYLNNIDNGSAVLQVGGMKIQVLSGKEGQRRGSIRPEDILLSTQPIASSARNLFKGQITEISDRGAYAFVKVSTPTPLTCMLTRSSIEELNLKTGVDVWLAFKASAVNIF